jgi:cellulose synthase operon protein C
MNSKKTTIALLTGTVMTTLLPGLALGATQLATRQAASTIAAPPVASSTTVSGENAPSAQPDTVDLAALYYYARNGETARVEAETRRLQLKFPGFAVPDDLYAPDTESQVDESSLWQLYERDDYLGIEEEITRIASAHPGWEPSSDFRAKLERRKMRFEMTAAHQAKDFAAIIRAGTGLDPMQETEIDLLWMLIDAYRANAMRDALTTVYRGILFRPGATAFPDELVLTTLQKAMDDIPATELRNAMDLLSANPQLAVVMRDLRLDLMRRELGDYAASVSGAAQPDAETVSIIRQAAESEGDPEDAALMGWYMLKINQPEEASRWFEQLMRTAPSSEAVRGVTLSLVHRSQEKEAFDFVSAHLDLLDNEDAFLVDQLSFPFKGDGKADIEDEIVARYSRAIQKTESADHARLLGWYAYNARQFEAANAWFAKAFEWRPEDDSLKGQLLALTRLGRKAELSSLREQHAGTYAAVFKELKTAPEPRGKNGKAVGNPNGVEARYVSSLRKKDYGACLSDLRAQEATAPLRPDTLVIKGWCLLGLNHLAEARQAFSEGLAGGGGKTDDAAYGLGLTLLRASLTDDAEALLMRHSLTPLRERELRAELLWQKARAAFDRKQYRQTLDALNARLEIMPEPVGISRMRAWSHYHLGNLAKSRAIFAQLNQVMADPANSRGIAAINERMGIGQ